MTHSASPTGEEPLRVDAHTQVHLVLSQLADGDCDGTVTPAACALWQSDESARQTWHAYHLIGDVLRAQDLRCTPLRERVFVEQLRVRLAQEPPVLAPQPRRVDAQGLTRRRWYMPAAAAAGVAGVAAVAALAVLQFREQPADGTAQMASSSASAQPTAVSLANAEDAAMIRDARIDMYLRAHQTMRNSAAAAMPGGALRNVDMLLPAR